MEFDTEVYIYEDYGQYTFRQKLKAIWSIIQGKEVEYSDVTTIEYEPEYQW